MDVYNIKDMKGGFFIGKFHPSVWHTSDFEVGVHRYIKGQVWPAHKHMKITEINYMISGTMKIKEQIVTEGNIFVIYPNEVANPEFLSDCQVLIVKTPSCPGDKILV